LTLWFAAKHPQGVERAFLYGVQTSRDLSRDADRLFHGQGTADLLFADSRSGK
jgi:hypothetical protein